MVYMHWNAFAPYWKLAGYHSLNIFAGKIQQQSLVFLTSLWKMNDGLCTHNSQKFYAVAILSNSITCPQEFSLTYPRKLAAQ